MIVQKYTLHEVKEKYSDRHGFMFRGSSDCNVNSTKLVCSLIKDKGISEHLPELIAQLDNRTFCFIYPEKTYFKSGLFFEITRGLSMMVGVFEIDILNAFLKEN